MTDTVTEVSVRDRLLAAAELVVGRDGVSNLTLDAVAREAGVSKGGLLYHFPSKSALVTGIVEKMARHCESEHARTIALDHGPGAFTRSYLRTRTEALVKSQEQPIHTALLAAAGTDPQYLEPIRERHRQWLEKFQNDGIDPAIAVIVRLAIDGLCLGRLLDLPLPKGELRDAVLEKLIEMTKHSQEKSHNQSSSKEGNAP